MANISSYNQLSSWNEDDDLLFVQQPDAPKKAHPSQMKEYILEGLDVSSVGGAGKYISAISEADGKISATAETMDAAPTEGSLKAVTSGGIKTAIDDSVSLKTATGNPITLTDAANANAEKLLMTIEPIQSGSGDPSPTNVRPISGISTASVQTTDGTDTNTASITLGQTVYGGSVNFKTGEVTVTHGMVDLGTLTYSYNAGNTRFLTTVSDMKAVNDWIAIDAYCSQYKKRPMAPGWNENNTFGTYSTTLYIRDTRFTDVAAFKTAMSGVQLCYELETPITLTLTPAELELLKGNNTITANGAEISLSYYPDNAIGALAEKVDDVQEQIAAEKSLTLVAKDAVSANMSKSFDIGSTNGIFLVVTGHGGMGDVFGMYLIKITRYAEGTMVRPIVTPSSNPPTVTATAISTTGKITIATGTAGCNVGIYRFNADI